MKTDGSATKRSTRSVRQRLATLPPVQFLKRYSPRLRRRQRPTIGFDQPPRELKQLALPLRPAPPALSTRIKIQLTRWAAWSAFAFGRTMDRAGAAASRLAAPVRVAWARIAAMVDPLVQRIAATTARLQPQPWEVTQTAQLMTRTHRVRRVLIGTLACEWTATIGLGAVIAGRALTGRASEGALVTTCGLVVCALSLTALALHAWLQHLVAAWRGMELFMCGNCGALRNFSPSLPCPACQSESTPVFPGQVPSAWSSIQCSIGSLVAGAPAGLAGGALLLTRLTFAG